MNKRRVVITGLGAVTPNGLTVAACWRNVVAGISGIRPVTHFDISDCATRIAGTIDEAFDISQYISGKEARKMDPFIHYGLAAGSQAFEDSGLLVTDANSPQIGVMIGAGIGGVGGIEAGYGTYLQGGARKISPFFVPANIINMISGHVSIKYGLRGPNLALVTACATGTHCIGVAARMIQCGDAEVMVAGGAEKASTPTAIAGFASARALSRHNDAPTQASRPFDKQRDGFVLSDGAGVVVLESLDHALARGARVYAEVIGFGMSADAHHMTQPLVDGEGAARCMRNALADAGIAPEQVDYVNAHGTSTPLGDIGETRALKAVFGEYAYRVPVSSTKSVTGHMLGAAGAVEAIFAILAMRDNVIPPTINLDEPDPECDLDYVPNVARPAPLAVTMSNSFGFGGTNGTLIFRRYPA